MDNQLMATKKTTYHELMRLTTRLGLFCLLVCSAVSCADDTDEAYYFVDEDILPYFAAFEAEASLRNISVDLQANRISAIIRQIAEDNVVGQCQSHIDGNHTVIIDQTSWERANHLEKEFIIFHELGHCYLDRDHLDSADQSGTCLSIMHGNATFCHNNYGIETRDNYLDELFLNL